MTSKPGQEAHRNTRRAASMFLQELVPEWFKHVRHNAFTLCEGSLAQEHAISVNDSFLIERLAHLDGSGSIKPISTSGYNLFVSTGPSGVVITVVRVLVLRE